MTFTYVLDLCSFTIIIIIIRLSKTQQAFKTSVIRQQEALEAVQANMPKLPETLKLHPKPAATKSTQGGKAYSAGNENVPPAAATANKTSGPDTIVLVTNEELENIPK